MSFPLSPLDQLGILPNLLNWKGVWNNAIQYYKNDLAVDPYNLAAYICISNTSLGQQPVLNNEWFEFFPHRTAVDGVGAGVGIGLTGGVLNPIVTNIGIRSFAGANGIGTATIGQVSQIFNLGLQGMIADAGISSQLTSGTLTIRNEGVVGAVLSGFGNTGTPQNIQLSNAGITQITAGAGIALTVDASNNYTLSNTYLERMVLGAGLFNIGTPQNQQLVAIPEAPYLDVLSVTGAPTPNIIPFGTVGVIPVTLLPNSRMEYQLQNGIADASPYWLMDLNGVWINLSSVVEPTTTVSVGVRDSTTPGGPYDYYGSGISGVNGKTAYSLIPSPSPAVYEGITSLGYIFMNPNDIRSAGLKLITDILIRPNAPASPPGDMTVTGVADVIQMGYYPNVRF